MQNRVDALQTSVASLSRRLDVLARALDTVPTPSPRTKRADKPSSSSTRKTELGLRLTQAQLRLSADRLS